MHILYDSYIFTVVCNKMNDSIYVDNVNLMKEEEDLSDKQDIIDETLAPTARVRSTENNTSEWSIIRFDTDIEEDVKGFNDLIPSSWITKRGTLCWYPMNDHQATIQKLVKQCTKPNFEWNRFSMKKIEENIGKLYMIFCIKFVLFFYIYILYILAVLTN